MKTRVMKLGDVPLGTSITARVLAVTPMPRGNTAITCTSADRPGEGFVCLYRRGQKPPRPGDVGCLTFTFGGPLGAYWRYSASRSQGGVN